MSVLGTKPSGETMTEKESAVSGLKTIHQDIDRLNPSDGLRAEIEMLVGIVNETDNREAKKIMQRIVKGYKQLLLDVEQSFVTAKHELDMYLVEVQQKNK